MSRFADDQLTDLKRISSERGRPGDYVPRIARSFYLDLCAHSECPHLVLRRKPTTTSLRKAGAGLSAGLATMAPDQPETICGPVVSLKRSILANQVMSFSHLNPELTSLAILSTLVLSHI